MSDQLPDLAAFVRPGDTVTWGQAQAEPRRLTRALVEQRHRFARTRVLLGIGAADTVAPEHADSFDFVSYCGTGANRALAAAGVLDLLTCHYSTLPRLIVDGPLRVDVVLLQVSPPDDQGRYSLGLANDHLLAALQTARVVLGEVNPEVPWTHGERCFRREDFALLVAATEPPLAGGRRAPTPRPRPTEPLPPRHRARSPRPRSSSRRSATSADADVPGAVRARRRR